jgi:hypothetical protein
LHHSIARRHGGQEEADDHRGTEAQRLEEEGEGEEAFRWGLKGLEDYMD